MRTLPVAVAATLFLGVPVAHAATPGVFADCMSAQAQPASVDLNCLRSDAYLSALTWRGRTARGSFNFPSYSVDAVNGIVTLPARVVVSRPRALGTTRAYTRLTIRLYGSARDREGLDRKMRYVLTCDLDQGWVPASVARPC